MKVRTYEAIVENGQVRLPADAQIPDRTKVYVIVPTSEPVSRVQIRTPRLAHPEQIADFAKEVEEEPEDAHV